MSNKEAYFFCAYALVSLPPISRIRYIMSNNKGIKNEAKNSFKRANLPFSGLWTWLLPYGLSGHTRFAP